MGWLYSGACVCIWRGLFWVEVFSDYLSPYYTTTTTTTPPGLSFILSAFKKVSPPVYPCHSRLSIRPRHTSSAPLGRSVAVFFSPCLFSSSVVSMCGGAHPPEELGFLFFCRLFVFSIYHRNVSSSGKKKKKQHNTGTREMCVL